MAQRVMPAMRPLFQEYDAVEFADFGCSTCHGADAREVNFNMPNSLPALRPVEIPAMFQSAEPIHVFMTQRVLPQMVQVLGAEPYAEDNPDGFGCLSCHDTDYD